MVSGRAAWAKAGLKRSQKILGLEEKSETGKHETLKEFGDTRCQRDWSKRRGSIRGFARFQHRVDGGRLPSGGKGVGGPGEVEDEEKEFQSVRGKVSKEGVRHKVRTGGGGRREARDSCGELADPKRAAEGGVER